MLLLARIIRFAYHQIFYPLKQYFKKKNEHGYVLSKEGKFEHRELVEKILGRKLVFGEEVHHINGKPWDNRRRNLALMSRDEHLKWHETLEWMLRNKKRPTIKWQKEKLINEFNAILF